MSLPPPDSDTAVLNCPSCRSPLRVGRRVETLSERCPVCRAEVTLTLFPRLYEEFALAREDVPADGDEAGCSFFPALRAEHVCDECGCFLSHRAAITWGARVLCLPCLHRLREVEKSPDFIGRARLDDRRALALVTWLAPFSLFTAPVALFLLFRQRGVPAGFVPRGRAMWWIALLLSVGWLAAWLVLFVAWASLVMDSFT